MQNKKIELWKKAVKTGIIKSNLIPMFAALMLALYTYHLSFIENIPNMIFALIGSAVIGGGWNIQQYI